MTALASRTSGGMPSADAVLAQAPDENFPVGGIGLARRRRAELLAIYGFARLVDDIGDETDGDRLASLDWVDRELDLLYVGRAPEHQVLRALAPTVRRHAIPDHPLRRLIEANRRDQAVTRYETFAQLLSYCQLSAAPVGELVLHVFAAATEDRVALSDRICAGLQVIEHLQDVGEDFARDRVYLPAEDLRRFAVTEADLGARHAPARLRELIAFEAGRAEALLREGAPLARRLPPVARLTVAGYIAGGRSALRALARARYDVLAGPPRARRRSLARDLPAAVMGR